MKNIPISFEALDAAAIRLADSVVEGLSPAVNEALADPIVRQLMAADGIDRASVEEMLRTAAAKVREKGAVQHDFERQSRCRMRA